MKEDDEVDVNENQGTTPAVVQRLRAAVQRAHETVVPPRGTPPEDRGQRLATIPRGEAEELRVSVDEYRGARFVSLRVWQRDERGAWWPTKKGLAIRLRELGVVAEALVVALEEHAA